MNTESEDMEQLDRAREAYDDAVLAMLPYAADGGESFDAALKAADAAFLNLASVIVTQYADRVVASMPAQIEKLRREHAMTKEDRAAQHLRDGDHGGNVKDCALCQQERKEDRIIARRGDHPPIHADEEHDWTAANTGEGIQIIVLQRALANCYMTARRELHRLKNTGRVELIHGLDSTSVERWQHIVRFCEESGCKSDFLRAALPTELTEGEALALSACRKLLTDSDYCDDCRTYHTGECGRGVEPVETLVESIFGEDV